MNTSVVACRRAVAAVALCVRACVRAASHRTIDGKPHAAYGSQRLWGSVAWGLGSFLVGSAIDHWGYDGIFYWTYGFSAALLLLLACQPASRGSRHGHNGARPLLTGEHERAAEAAGDAAAGFTASPAAAASASSALLLSPQPASKSADKASAHKKEAAASAPGLLSSVALVAAGESRGAPGFRHFVLMVRRKRERALRGFSLYS